MAVKREFWGEAPGGAPIYVYHITNNSGMEVDVLNYGCTIRNVFVPDKDGNKVDVVLGYDDYKEYFDNSCFLGVAVGPSANRIAEAKYKIDGKEYILPINDGPNNLHSDMNNGFHKRIWDAEEGEDFVKFTLKAEDGDLDEDTVMDAALEAGAEDMITNEDNFQILTDPSDYPAVDDALRKAGFEIVESEVEYVPSVESTPDEKDLKKLKKLVTFLEDNDDVQNVHTNCAVDLDEVE